jgi:hypothetical protein
LSLKRVSFSNVLKAKGNVRKEWKNFRGISLLSTPGKLSGRVLIESISEITEVQIRDEQDGFRKGSGCVDQVFALTCVCEKYHAHKYHTHAYTTP